MKRAALCIALALFVVVPSPAAEAKIKWGNYNMWIDGRFDFHTWIWAISECPGDVPDCVTVLALPQPNAKANRGRGEAHLVDGKYTLEWDDPFGLRCGNVYYGNTIPTHDVWTWDDAPMSGTGTMQSFFDTDCNGGPPGSYVYPFNLVRL